MTNLKRSFFWAALYLAVIFLLGQTDYTGRPIINFASYFYLAVILAVPVTLFFPSISRVSSFVPLFIWAGVYLVLLQTIDRGLSATVGEFSVIVLEFVLLESGVWFAYQLAVQLSHAESIMDALALSAFPNRAHDIEAEHQRIKIELTRSRRYHRPLSLVVIESLGDDKKIAVEMLKGIQHDLMNRFTSARVGQIIDDRIRQTDLVLRDHRGRFVILCPETDLASAELLAKRIILAIKERTDLQALSGVSAFPDEALTFDDLLHKARERLVRSHELPENQVVLAASKIKLRSRAMSVLGMISSYEEEWIKKFDPQKRIITGTAYLIAKRAVDLFLVIIALPFWLPLIGFIALVIRVTSPGAPVMFKQLRTGKGGQRFQMYKFRSMVPNAEALKATYAHLNELQWPDFKITNDPRITSIGRFLRKTSLDELPQLFNVLRGEMSLVGPRPTSFGPETYKLWHTERLDVAPGLTGLWQIIGRAQLEFDDRLRLDIAYIERRSLWLDINILFHTVTAVFKQRGAH